MRPPAELDRAALDRKEARARPVLSVFELQARPWLVGGALILADRCLAPIVAFLASLPAGAAVLVDYPALVDHLDALRARRAWRLTDPGGEWAMRESPQDGADEAGLVARAVAGDRRAYDALAGQALLKLRATVGRLLGNPDEAEDVVQQALLRGWGSLGGFGGRARFSTWLCSIGVRVALDHLRQAKRWRAGAQLLYADACRDDDSRAASLVGALHSPGAAFDAREHIAFCLVCVGRSLPADAHVAVVSRDLLGMSNEEGAEATGLSRGAFRHRLAEGRALLVERFEGLCALVNQEGPCWQCAGLRQVAPPDRRGDDPPVLPGATASASERHQARVAIAKAADLAGPSHALHDLMLRSICALEEAGWGDEAHAGACGPPDPEA